MPISFRFAIPASLRAGGIQLCAKDELMALASLKTGYFDPSRGELAAAIKGGFCKVPLPAKTDKLVAFVLDREVQMRDVSSTAMVISVMVDSWVYRVTLFRKEAAPATKSNGHRDAWTLEGIKMLRPPVGAKLLEEGQKAAGKAAAPTPINEPAMLQSSVPADQMRPRSRVESEVYQ